MEVTDDMQHGPESAPKLTEWAKEPDVSALKSDLEGATEYHNSQVRLIEDRRMLIKGKNPKAPFKPKKNRSAVEPKLVRRQLEWRYSALSEPILGAPKLFDVRPVTFEDVDAAKQNELLVNHQFRNKMNLVKFVDDLVHSTADDGTAIVQVGWERVTTMVPVEVPVWSYRTFANEVEYQNFAQAVQAYTADPEGFNAQADEAMQRAMAYYSETGQANVAEQTGVEQQMQERVLQNHPTASIRVPDNVYIDPSCEGNIKKAGFVIVSFETSKAELLKQGDRYKNLDQIKWEQLTNLSDSTHVASMGDKSFQYKDALRKRVIAYEYWGYADIDGSETLKPIVATWIGDTMIRMEENPFPNGFLPFVVIPYIPIKRELYGESDADLLGDHQAISGALTRGMIDLMGRSANAQQGFAKNFLDPVNRRKMEDGEDFEFLPGTNPDQGFVQLKYPEIPQSALMLLQQQNLEAEALTGVKSFSGGLSGNAYGDVVAGIKGVLDAAAKREMSILRRLTAGIVEIGRMFMAMNAVFLSDEEIIRVTNEEFIAISREALAGDFDLIVDISTAEVDESRAQDLSFMLQTLGNSVDWGVTKIILAEIARLKRMPDLEKAIKDYEPTPDPFQEQMKQLEIQYKQAQIEELLSRAKSHNAKAEELETKADLNNVNFVEQETGTKHARELEKLGMQADANKELKIMDALLKPAKEGESKPNLPAALGYNQLSKGLGKL